MNKNKYVAIAFVLTILGATTPPASGQASKKQPPNAAFSGDFFIISSVDLDKQQLLLKLPTEVTELMQVDGKTHYFDKEGRSIRFSDLRAGDTVYIQSNRGPSGTTAVTLRKGPMTQSELRRRYLHGEN